METDPIITTTPPVEPRSEEARFSTMTAARRKALEEANHILFRDVRTCVLEIGCGHGHMLTAYAEAHPEQMCIGIDIIADRITRANRKKNRARLPNLHFINTSAEDFLATIPAHISIADIFVLFPDPWPKRRHHKNRLMQSEFLGALSRWVSPNSRLYFRTDDISYFTATEAIVGAHPDWSINPDPWAFEFTTVFQARASNHHSLVAAPKSAH